MDIENAIATLETRIGKAGISKFLYKIDTEAGHEESPEEEEILRAVHEFLKELFPDCDPYDRS